MGSVGSELLGVSGFRGEGIDGIELKRLFLAGKSRLFSRVESVGFYEGFIESSTGCCIGAS